MLRPDPGDGTQQAGAEDGSGQASICLTGVGAGRTRRRDDAAAGKRRRGVDAAHRRCRRLRGSQRGQEAWGTARGRGGREEEHGHRHTREPLRRRRAQRAPAPARAVGVEEGLHGAPRRLTARSVTVTLP